MASFERWGNREVSHWLGRKYWGQGIATTALAQFLGNVPLRPLSEHMAQDNLASIRVLEKCGFVRVEQDKGFVHARQAEIEEVILQLDA